MGRGEQTREHIIERAAGLFNQKGFAGASLADIMDATGLQKGGIYRHFDSKEELAVEAFGFATRRMAERFAAALEGRRHAADRLHALIGVYLSVATDPPVPGGCPLLSAAVESDHGNPLLREKARAAMTEMRQLVARVVARGIERGELRRHLDPGRVATVFTASLEGGIMLAQLYDDPAYANAAGEHLEEYVAQQLRA